ECVGMVQPSAMRSPRVAPPRRRWRIRVILNSTWLCFTAGVGQQGASPVLCWGRGGRGGGCGGVRPPDPAAAPPARGLGRAGRAGVEGMAREEPRGPGKPGTADALVQRVVALTCAEPPGEATHWDRTRHGRDDGAVLAHGAAGLGGARPAAAPATPFQALGRP